MVPEAKYPLTFVVIEHPTRGEDDDVGQDEWHDEECWGGATRTCVFGRIVTIWDAKKGFFGGVGGRGVDVDGLLWDRTAETRGISVVGAEELVFAAVGFGAVAVGGVVGQRLE